MDCSLPAEVAIHPKYRTLWISGDEECPCDGIIFPSLAELVINARSPILLILAITTDPYGLDTERRYDNLQKLRTAIKADARFQDVEVVSVICYSGRVRKNKFKKCKSMEDVARSVISPLGMGESERMSLLRFVRIQRRTYIEKARSDVLKSDVVRVNSMNKRKIIFLHFLNHRNYQPLQVLNELVGELPKHRVGHELVA